MQLTSCLTGLDSIAVLLFNQQQIYFSAKSKPVKDEASRGTVILPIYLREITLTIGGITTLRLVVSSLTRLDSTASLHTNNNIV